MAKGNNNFNGEILHFGPCRFRVNGSGTLNLFLRSLDDVRNSTLPTITMALITNREPVILANFSEQRAQLELNTTELGEYFTISKIILFVKPIFSGYPQ